MKRKNLPLMLVLMISVEMIIAPVASAQQATGALGVIQNVVAPIVQQIFQQQNQQAAMAMTSQKIALINQQLTPLPDKYFNPQRMQQIPGLFAYLGKNGIRAEDLNCKTLSSKPDKIVPQVCSATSAIQGGASMQMQVWEAEAYKEAYNKVSEEYKNYSVESTSAAFQDQGVGCVKKASDILNGFFLYRYNELNALTAKIEALNNSFREGSKADLDQIEDLTAELDGGSNELVDKALGRNPKLFENGSTQDPSCSALFTGDRFNEEGKEGGLNGINKLLKTTYELPSGGAKYSGQSYAQASAAVETDIKNIAIKVATQAKLNFNSMTERGVSGFIAGLKTNVSSATGVNGALTADLFSDFQSKFNGKNEDLVKTSVDLNKKLKEAGIDSSEAFNQLRSKSSTLFDSEVASIQNQVKNNCLKRSIGDVKNITDRIEQRGASDSANKVKSVFELAIERILGDDKLTIEQKLEQVRAAEAQSNNRYKLKNLRAMDVLRENNGKLVATQIQQKDINTPSKYIKQLAKTCEIQYSRSTVNGAPSIQQTVESLRNLRKDYENFAETSAQEMQAAVTNKLLNCPGDTTGQTVGSCDGAKFNNTSGSFCARTASICSGKMRACTEATQKVVTKKKQDKKIVVDRYKDKLKSNKAQLVNLFDMTFRKYQAEGEFMAGQFKGEAGFSTPVGIQREVPEGSRYLTSFAQATSGSPDGRLLLEDPDKLVELFKANIEKLKTSVKEQQDKIIGGGRGGLIASHLDLVKKNYSAAQRDMESIAQQCGDKAAEMIRAETERANKLAEAMEKKNTELGEKREKMCALYSMAQIDPKSACSESIKDLMFDGTSAANLKAHCRSGGHDENDNDDSGIKVSSICQMKEYRDGKSRKERASMIFIPSEDKDGKPILIAGKPKGELIPDLDQAPDPKNIAEMCADLRKEKPPKGSDTSYSFANNGENASGKPQRIQFVSEDKEQLRTDIIARYQIDNNSDSSSQGEGSDSLDAPAYCNAGNNSGREVMEGISNLGQAIDGPASTRRQ